MGDGLVFSPSLSQVTPLFKHPLPTLAHAGLVFDRYLPIWEGEAWGHPPQPKPKRVEELQPRLKEFADAFNKRQKDKRHQDLLSHYHQRWDRLTQPLGLKLASFVVQWRLVSGLGAAHPTENGFSFDAVMGVPYLTGSAIKGVCRQAAKLEGVDPGEIEQLFGPETVKADESTTGRGALIFYDAFPARWPGLRVEVMNCHHPDYYGQSEGDQKHALPNPLENENPVPIFFLAVAEKSEFVFRFACRDGDEARLERVEELLESGLDLLGIGAKTAVGYGAMWSRFRYEEIMLDQS
ncbi:MAG: type III-B CRISPR module RAMP protein Cmr6 [Magnetococcales bacterium]|nr:type III-B CRISPR module RAMP protein Cmr6 [Magnetococcales bacterium]